MRNMFRISSIKEIRQIISAVLFSVLFSCFTAFGFTSPIVNNGSYGKVGFLLCFVFLLIACIPVSCFLFSVLDRFSGKKLALKNSSSSSCFTKEWGLLFGLTVLLWGVFWILFFPGYFSPDSMDSIFQALGAKELKNHHPLVFTALVTPFAWLGNAVGNIEIGMGLFSLLTLVFFAAVCSYIAMWVKSCAGSRKLFLFCIIFLILNPLLIQYSHAALKDVWFAGFAALFALNVAKYLISSDKRIGNLIAIAIAGLLTCLFRGNGLFLVVPTLLVMSFCVKPGRSRIFVVASQKVV